MMHRGAIRVGVVLAVLALAGAPRALAQQGGLPDEVVTAPHLTEQHTQTLRQFVQGHAAAMGTATGDAMRDARTAILQPLARSNASVAFRIRYGGVVADALAPLMQGGGELAQVNALAIAGELATDDAVKLFDAGRTSDKPAVRYSAAAAAGTMLRKAANAAAGANLLNANRVDELIRKLGEMLAVEQDPLVIDAIMSALAASQALSDAQRRAGVAQLAAGVAALVDRQAGKPFGDVVLEGFVRTADAVSAVLQTPGAVPQDTLKECGRIGQMMVAHAHRVVAAKAVPAGAEGASQRELLRQVTVSGQNIILLSAQKLNQGIEIKQADFGPIRNGNNAGDADFLNRAQDLLEAVTRPPFNLAPVK